jgi:tetratricopeptide (TPR) repeat protein
MQPTIYIQPGKASLKVNFRRFLGMEIDAVDRLVLHVIEEVAADNSDFDKVIKFVVSFSNEYSLSQEILLKLSSIFGKDSMYREKYVISRACASRYSGKLREDTLIEAGKTALLLGLDELAVREFKEMLEENPENVEALCGYGTVLAKKGKTDAARVQYKTALELNPFHLVSCQQ